MAETSTTAPPNLDPVVDESEEVANMRHELHVMASSGRTEEVLDKGHVITVEQIRKAPEKSIRQLYARLEAHIASRNTDIIIDGFLGLVSNVCNTVLPIDDVEILRKDLKNNYLLKQELSHGAVKLRECGGTAVAAASGFLTIAKHVEWNKLIPEGEAEVVWGEGDPRSSYFSPPIAQFVPSQDSLAFVLGAHELGDWWAKIGGSRMTLPPYYLQKTPIHMECPVFRVLVPGDHELGDWWAIWSNPSCCLGNCNDHLNKHYH